jgi:hypothetical protein
MITFHKLEGKLFITYHCDECNSDSGITGLVEELCQYGVDNCPDNLYQAWKILRLGSSDYRREGQHHEHKIIESALQNIRKNS